MLEVKDLYKVYKPKKGDPVIALNHISVKFPETGLIFILGKSGSGKSTFLNVMGGLDKADSGEIIIKNKSSKDFSQDDFDSYRNTYLGFIFQEYNILDEFSIHDNIALALELQHQKATDQQIDQILEEVDLKGFAKRKPNELSGGQKQRVAIARALVKNPQIIFADEPTGALDSKTGQQVFDTLKKLSKDKLVVVVSHDRDFAEQFGDRVIELKDGVIISDISKISVPSKQEGTGLKVIGDVIRIDKGHHLTPEDVNVINEAIDKNSQDSFVSLNPAINKDICEKGRISESGDRESFIETDVSKIPPEAGNFKVIKSSLPFRSALKMAGSSLKVKPFRLVLTILLSLVAFAMFGLADTMSAYNKYDATVSSIADSNINYASFRKASEVVHHYGNQTYTTTETRMFSDQNLSDLNTKTGMTFQGVYGVSDSVGNPNTIGFSNLGDQQYLTSYNTYGLAGFLSIDENSLPVGAVLAEGALPVKQNDLCLTVYEYESFKAAGYDYRSATEGISDQIAPKDITMKKLIGKPLYLSNLGETYTITGFLDTKLDESRYEDLKKAGGDTTDLKLSLLSMELSNLMRYSYHSLGFVSPAALNYLSQKPKTFSANGYSIYQGFGGVAGKNTIYSFQSYQKDRLSFFFDGSEPDALKDKEVIPNVSDYCDSLSAMMDNSHPSDLDSEDVVSTYQQASFTNIGNLIRYGIPDAAFFKTAANHYEDFYSQHSDLFTIYSSGNPIQEGDTDDQKKEKKIQALVSYLYGYLSGKDDLLYSDDVAIAFKALFQKYYARYQTSAFTTDEADYSTEGKDPAISAKAKVVGVNYYQYQQFTFASHDFLALFFDDVDGKWSYALAAMPSDRAGIRKLVNIHYEEGNADSVYYRLNNNAVSTLSSINSTFEGLSKTFLYIGIAFAVFASLMLYNFISISINSKKREIGILRAVGARGKDVFSIFFTESMIISLINFLLASIAVFIICAVINSKVRTSLGLEVTLLIPGIRQLALVLAVSLLVAFIGSFLPVFKIARKRPIDAIQNR